MDDWNKFHVSVISLTFPSWKVKVAQSCPALCNPMDYTVHGILWARILKWVAFPFSRGSSQPMNRTQVSHIAGRFFTSWAMGEAQNTGVGSLSLLQRIFLTQEWNQGLLHCRQILYQLSHKGSPIILEWAAYPFSRGSVWPRDRTGVSCIAGGFHIPSIFLDHRNRKINKIQSLSLRSFSSMKDMQSITYILHDK